MATFVGRHIIISPDYLTSEARHQFVYLNSCITMPTPAPGCIRDTNYLISGFEKKMLCLMCFWQSILGTKVDGGGDAANRCVMRAQCH